MRRDLLLWAVALAATAAAEEPPKARSHTVVGELTRVDGASHSITVRSIEGEPRETEVFVEDGKTRFAWKGRLIRFEELRARDHVVVTCIDDAAGMHHAQLVRLVSGSNAAPGPSPSPGKAPPRPLKPGASPLRPGAG